MTSVEQNLVSLPRWQTSLLVLLPPPSQLSLSSCPTFPLARSSYSPHIFFSTSSSHSDPLSHFSRMSPAIRGDSDYVPDSQQLDPRVQGNSKSLSQQTNRYTPLVGLRDTLSLVDFDHDSISTASAATNDVSRLPVSSHHVTENDPFRRMIQLIKLGKGQLADYYQDLGNIPSGSWLYSTEKVLVDLTNLIGYVHEERKLGKMTFKGDRSINIRLANTVVKKLDDVLKEIAKLSPEPVSEAQQRVKAATRVLLEDDMDFISDTGSVFGETDDNVKEEEVGERMDFSFRDDRSVNSQEDFNDRASTPTSPIKKRSRSASFHEVPRSIDRSTTTPAAEPDSSYVPSRPIHGIIPISDRTLRSHIRPHEQHENRVPSLDIPLPSNPLPPNPVPGTPPLPSLPSVRSSAAYDGSHSLSEAEQLRLKADHQRVEHAAFLEINRLQKEEIARLERLRAEKEKREKDQLEKDEAIRKQLDLDKVREQQLKTDSSMEGTPDFQSDQLRLLYEQFQKTRQHQVNGEGSSKDKATTPSFVSNFGDLNDTITAPTLRVVKVKEDFFFTPINTDHDDYFNWVACQSLVLLQESPRNHFSLHLFLLFIKNLIDEAGSLLPNITIEVKQGNAEAPKATKPVTFVDLSQEESGFINTETLYPRTMDQPRIDDTNVVDVQMPSNGINGGVKDIEMDDNILDEHRRKRDELLNTERKWFEMPPAVTRTGDTLPARPATRRNTTKPGSLPPYIPPVQGAPDFLGRYGPPPAVNKATRPTNPPSANLSNIANMVNQKFPNASIPDKVSLTKSFAEAAASSSRTPPKSNRFPIVEDASPKQSNTQLNQSSKGKTVKDWNGWQQVKRKDFKPTNKGTNPCELHLRATSGSFGSLDGLYGKALTDAIGYKCRCVVDNSSEIKFNFERARFTDRKDLIITLDRPLTKESTIMLRKAVAYVDDSSEENDVAYLNRATTSSFKFFGVPTIYPDGSRVDPMVFLDDFKRHPAWKDVHFVGAPRWVVAKGKELDFTGLLLVEIRDSDDGAIGKTLLNTTIDFAGIQRGFEIERDARQPSSSNRPHPPLMFEDAQPYFPPVEQGTTFSPFSTFYSAENHFSLLCFDSEPMPFTDFTYTSQNVHRNLSFIPAFLERHKLDFDFCFFQEVPFGKIRNIPSSENEEGSPLVDAARHPNWTCVHQLSRHKNTAVAIYVNNRVLDNHTIIQDLFTIDDENVLVIRIVNNDTNKSFSMANVYNRPNSGNRTIDRFVNRLSGIEDLAICAGDFNLHHSEWDDISVNDTSAEGLLQELTIAGLSLLNNEYTPTWFHPSGKTSVLDLFFCSDVNTDLLSPSITIDPDARITGDHALLILRFDRRERTVKEHRYIPKNSDQESKFVTVIELAIEEWSILEDVDIVTADVYTMCNKAQQRITSSRTRAATRGL
ncbi:hypothetical protein M378DRAFT_18886 [Amanita muscaria Koide BX008]|uniref:Endonuclease/exonuclease/phosphatase domain-containing protein n=1 Tax=Amanita muscaria (strain Koide BX008) TaxID=946122 RepID=A0A0C2RW17_AMAMK|nr:hypothetical protein M378DRAFT_18886 [Amanita muscaria Koide BX008]